MRYEAPSSQPLVAMRSLGLLVALMACSSPSSPPPEPASAPSPPEATPSGGSGPSSEAPQQVAQGPASCADVSHSGCFIAVPAGTVPLGAQSEAPDQPGFDPDAAPEEGPVTPTPVDAFYLQRSEVTLADWRRCRDDGPCTDDHLLPRAAEAAGVPSQGELPVWGITQEGAVTYCGFIEARLPTEAEWALAARGEAGRRYVWGETARCPRTPLQQTDDDLGGEQTPLDHACGPIVQALSSHPGLTSQMLDDATKTLGEDDLIAFCSAHTGADVATLWTQLQLLGGTTPVPLPDAAAPSVPRDADCTTTGPKILGELSAEGPHGLYAMEGNVAEWTQTPYAARHGGSPTPLFTVRGGSWLGTTPAEFRAARRMGLPAQMALPDMGMRCAADRLGGTP